MNDKADLTPNGWTGQYFRTWQFGNPLSASIEGTPFQVRGTDPASAADTLNWVNNGMQTGPGTPAPSGADPGTLGKFRQWIIDNAEPQWLKDVAIGGTGVFVGIVLLAFGLLFLWKSGD